MTSPEAPRVPGDAIVPRVAAFYQSIDDKYGIRREDIAAKTEEVVRQRRLEREIAERVLNEAENVSQRAIGHTAVRGANTAGIMI